jgi:hypothetical protein
LNPIGESVVKTVGDKHHRRSVFQPHLSIGKYPFPDIADDSTGGEREEGRGREGSRAPKGIKEYEYDSYSYSHLANTKKSEKE